VRVPRHTMPSLWMVATPENLEPRVVTFHCPSCTDPDNSRLIHINLPTEPTSARLVKTRHKAAPPVRFLMRVTRAQVEQILADFGRHDNGDILRAIFHHKGDTGDDSSTGAGGRAKLA
jgi:hypothetical protein